MTERNVYACDGCGNVTKTPDGEWVRSQHYIDVLEFSRTGQGKKAKYHLCHKVNEGDGEACVRSDFQENPEDRNVSIRWAYDRDAERIVGANWTEHWHYDGGWDDHEARREEFPDWVEERAQTLEALLYDD